MTKLLAFIVFFVMFFYLVLNTSLVSEKALEWVNKHPKDSSAPEVLYRTARWCDYLGDDARAVADYWELYLRYPERGDLCAPGLYHAADLLRQTIPGKQRARNCLEIVMSQYEANEEWNTKAKRLYDEINFMR